MASKLLKILKIVPFALFSAQIFATDIYEPPKFKSREEKLGHTIKKANINQELSYKVDESLGSGRTIASDNDETQEDKNYRGESSRNPSSVNAPKIDKKEEENNYLKKKETLPFWRYDRSHLNP